MTLPNAPGSIDYTHSLNNLDAMARALPRWLLDAEPAQRQTYAASLARMHRAQQAASEVLSTIQPLMAFAEHHLRRAVHERFQVWLDVQRVQLEHYVWFYDAPISTALPVARKPQLNRRGSLLQAALQNFSETEAQPANIAHGSRLLDGQRVLAQISAAQFMALCRELDLGRLYQEHLNTVFNPGLPVASWQGEVSAERLALLASLRSAALEHAAHRAFMRQALSATGYRALLAVCAGEGTLQASHLMLYGHALPGVLLFHFSEGEAVAPRTLLYLPGCRDEELYVVEGRQQLRAQLNQLLALPAFKKALVRQAPLLEQPALINRLKSPLAAGQLTEQALRGPLFDTLAAAQCLQRHQDSRCVAVPTEALDQEAREERLAVLETIGLGLLNVAALLSPVLNATLLAVGIYQLAREVYLSLDDWSHGRVEEAHEHLLGVVENVAAGLVVGVAGYRLSRSVQESRWFQALRPVRLEGGSVGLWDPQLSVYRQRAAINAPLASDGLLHQGGRTYLPLDGHVCEVRQEPGSDQWRLLHPDRPAYSPVLEHNGDGAWRHRLEQPWTWNSPVYAFRRLGPLAEGMSDADIEQVLRWAAIDEPQLCQVHADNAPLPALWRVASEHWRLNRDIELFIEGLGRAQVSDEGMAGYLLPYLAGWRPGVVVQVSSGATLRSALSVLLDRQWLAELGLGGQALEANSWAALCQRLAAQARLQRAGLFEHCYAAQVPVSAQARLLQRDFPGLPTRLADALLAPLGEAAITAMLGRQRVPLAVAQQARQALREYRLLQARQGFDWNWWRNERFARLVQGLLPTAMNLGDAQALKTALQQASPAQMATAMGLAPEPSWFRMPLRLDRQRLGYPLSGRGAAASRHAYYVDQFKQLYPHMGDEELAQYVESLQQAALNPQRVFEAKQQELQHLRDALDRWVVGNGTNASRQAQPQRRRLASELVRAWRRQIPRLGGGQGYRLDLTGLQIEQLPVFSAEITFDHVDHLCLTGAGLRLIPNGFLDSFTRLRILELGQNTLVELPPQIAEMTRLEVLLCAGNSISLTASTAQMFARLRRLEHLDLNDNPLTVAPDLRGASNLRMLQLRNTRLSALPPGYLNLARLEFADLRDNALRALPTELFEATGQPVRSLYIQGNPLSETTREQILNLHRLRGVNLGQLPQVRENIAADVWLEGNEGILAVEREARWRSLRDEPASGEFFRLLGELSRTAQYINNRAELARGVWEMVDLACEDAGLRGELFDLAGNPTTCGDSVTLNFSALQTRVEVYKALAAGDQATAGTRLLALGRGLFRLEQVDRLVLDDVRERLLAGGRRVDEVEVGLAWRINLAKPLGLPGQPEAMLYPAMAPIAPAALAEAQQRVLAAETPQALEDFLLCQPFWCNYLRQAHSAAFEQVRQGMNADEELLEARRATLTDGEYLAGYARLQQAYQAGVDALLRRLTREVQTSP